MKTRKNRIWALLCSVFVAGELAVMLDVVSVLLGKALSVPKFAVLLLALFLMAWGLSMKFGRFCRRMAAALAVLTGLLLAAVLGWTGIRQGLRYEAPDQGKARLYGGKKVMLLVPHQDDDVNVLGGVIEEYVKYGSEVYIVFSTNGDYAGLAETRFAEALTAAEQMGVPEDHVIFLGYGDQWAEDGPHLYNAESGVVLRSHYGREETYGTAARGAYREGRSYTLDHFLEDIQSVILEHRADVLYCVDQDYNDDHRALSMAFEKVMGRILKEEPDYRPGVFKGYAYDTAWEAVADFYGENLLATQNVFAPPYEEKVEIYRWEERVRLPVHAEGLSRSVFNAGAQEVLNAYASQGAETRGVQIINSDKVFWQRRTDSLLHQATLEAASGDVSVLNDFMVLEDRDILKDVEDYRDGAWIPEGQDPVWVTFEEPRDLKELVLYDLPDPDVNVGNARIEFDDGSAVETGPLDPGGAASRFAVDKKAVSSFRVTLTQVEGEGGLTELEAFAAEEAGLPFVKLMDEASNFAYDYWLVPSGEQVFSLYNRGQEAYRLTCSNDRCSAVWEGERIRITCPVGEKTTVTVSSEDGTCSDSVVIRNPGPWERRLILLGLRAEELLVNLCNDKRIHERIFVCRLWEKAAAVLGK